MDPEVGEELEEIVVPLLGEALDEGPSDACGHVPIDGPDVVPRLVLPHLRELDPPSMKRRVIVPRESGADQTRREDLQVAHAACEGDAVLRFAAAEEHGYAVSRLRGLAAPESRRPRDRATA